MNELPHQALTEIRASHKEREDEAFTYLVPEAPPDLPEIERDKFKSFTDLVLGLNTYKLWVHNNLNKSLNEILIGDNLEDLNNALEGCYSGYDQTHILWKIMQGDFYPNEEGNELGIEDIANEIMGNEQEKLPLGSVPVSLRFNSANEWHLAYDRFNTIIHNIKNGMTAFEGFYQMVQRSRDVETFESRAKILSPLTTRLYQSIELGERMLVNKFKHERLDISMVKSLFGVWSLDIAKGMDVQIKIPDEFGDIAFDYDTAQLQEVFTNCITNSKIEYGIHGVVPEDTEAQKYPIIVTLSPGPTNRSGSFIDINITDRGPGIDDEIVSQGEFPYKVSRHSKSVKDSTGTGMHELGVFLKEEYHFGGLIPGNEYEEVKEDGEIVNKKIGAKVTLRLRVLGKDEQPGPKR